MVTVSITEHCIQQEVARKQREGGRSWKRKNDPVGHTDFGGPEHLKDRSQRVFFHTKP
jgi:hypothetical protein